MPTTPEFVNLILRDDNQVPYEWAMRTVRFVLGKSEREARELVRHASWLGRHKCGTYPVAVAQAFVDEAGRLAVPQGHPNLFEIEAVTEVGEGAAACSFCGKVASDVRKLLAGKGAFICDPCVLAAAQGLSEDLTAQRFNYVHELLAWHFPGVRKEDIVSSSRTFPERVRADLQIAAEKIFAEGAVKTVALHGGYDYEQTTIATLLLADRNAKTIGPLRYQDVDVGEDEPVRCLESALWLRRDGELPYVALLVRQREMRGGATIHIEIAAAAGGAGTAVCERHFHALEQAVASAGSYRGKVLSLEQTDMYSGMASGITVHRLAPVARGEIILPEATINLLERNIVQFAQQRATLRKLGLSTKKGLLFHGPPGTGKTHTIRYLASALAGHTTLLITAEQVALLPEYFTLARLLQPSILVIEDADLIAREREKMDSPCEEVMLNKLLNEMDGLTQDAEVFFILTTNRPEMLERALASRPGRVDQAIEFPLPDEDGRRKLVALYGRGLDLGRELVERLVARTAGVSASFIKELMRRTAQYWLADGGGKVTLRHADAALEEMLFSGGRLNRELLGSPGSPGP